MKRPHLISICICAYCAMNAADLFRSWIQARGASLDLLAFALWCAPVMAFWVRRSPWPTVAGENPAALGLALVFSFFGLTGALRFLSHLGLALSLFALVPFMPLHLVWLASSCSWMSVFDWLGGRFFPGYVPVLKLAAASLPSLYLAVRFSRTERGMA